MRRLIPQILLGMITVAALGVFMAKIVEAHSASNLTTLTIAEDSFRNYDFEAQVDDPNGVDWPVTMVFGNNATQAKVESGYENQGVPCCFGFIKYARVNDGGWAWYSIRGIKDQTCNGCPDPPPRFISQVPSMDMGRSGDIVMDKPIALFYPASESTIGATFSMV